MTTTVSSAAAREARERLAEVLFASSVGQAEAMPEQKFEVGSLLFAGNTRSGQ